MNWWNSFLSKCFHITLSKDLPTFYTEDKPMIDVNELNAVQDRVFGNVAYQPREVHGDEVTFCNLATLAVAAGVGCNQLTRPTGGEPYTADQIYHLFQESTNFYRQSMPVCQDLVNKGVLIFAILPSWKLKQSHGHINTLTTGVGDQSGRWGAFTPLCMNLGRAGTCFRRKGVNWAFQAIPEFYSWGHFA